jgi:predicted transglutaminase-like cysteine proteinase
MSTRIAQPAVRGAGAQRRRAAGRARCRPALLAALLALGLSAAPAAALELGFARSVTPGLVQRYAARFGPQAGPRIGAWREFVRSVPAGQRQPAAEPLQLLGTVNAFFNRITFVDDLPHWRADDYWASPAEAVASNGADCEDFSIAKYFALKELGVPIQRLRITYVKAVRLNQAHMVLAYYAEPDAVPLILDNLENAVKPASQRPDLVPVYSFNDEDVLLARPGQRGIKAGSASKVRRWRALLDKLEGELRY